MASNRPVRWLWRLLRAGRRSGLLTAGWEHPLDVIRTLVACGLGMRSIHAVHAAATPDAVAMVDEHRALTYREANLEIDQWACALRDRLGAAPGRAAMIVMENRVEYLITWFALFRLGITCAHAGRHWTADELEPLLELSRARVVVVSDRTVEIPLAVARRHPELDLRIAWVGEGEAPAGVHRYDALLEEQRSSQGSLRAKRSPSSNVVYTSGTTGRPKGAVRNLDSVGLWGLLEILERLPLHRGDRHLVVAPLYHSAAQVFALMNTALGASVHLQERFDAEETLRRLSQMRIESLFLVPTMIHRLLDLPSEAHRRWRSPHLRALVSGAAPFSHELRKRAIDRFGANVVFDFYGATELGWVTLVDGREMLQRPGTVGRAIAGQEIGIFDDAGHRLGPRETGVIYTRSRQVMQGYMQDEESTRAARRDGWLTVDDVGWLDEDGYLFLAGRSRDMIISGGINIYPLEVENALLSHPFIEDVSVIGIPDPEWGERPVAVVVAKEGFDAAGVEAYAREHLAPYKVPRRWECVEELPRNPTGKVLKRELVARFSPTV